MTEPPIRYVDEELTDDDIAWLNAHATGERYERRRWPLVPINADPALLRLVER